MKNILWGNNNKFSWLPSVTNDHIFWLPMFPGNHPPGSSRLPCVSNCRFLTSSRTFSWSTCCRMCCRWFSWAIPMRSSFLSVSLSRARPAGVEEMEREASEQYPGGRTCILVVASSDKKKFITKCRWCRTEGPPRSMLIGLMMCTEKTHLCKREHWNFI